ncbi:hypothetical protein D9M68_465130 [compost metagenome]
MELAALVVALPHRRLGQLGHALGNIGMRVGLQPLAQGQQGAVFQGVAEQRLEALRREGRFEHQARQPLQRFAHTLPGAAPPGAHRGQQQLFAQQALADPRQEAEQARRLQHPAAQGVGHQHPAVAHRIQQAGHAQGRVGAQLQGVAVVVVEAAQHGVDALQAAQGLEVEGGVAHRQVMALHQREAELAREVEVLEIGLVEAPRRQQHHQGRLAIAGGLADQGFLQGAEVAGQVLHPQVAVELGQRAGDDLPVLQGVAGAGGRLGAVGQHVPAAVGVAGQVHRVAVQEDAAGRLHTLAGPEEVGMAEDQFAGQQPLGQQLLLAIQVGQHGVEQARALRHAGGDGLPFLGREQVGQQVQFPGAVGTLGIGVDVVGDAIFLDLPRQQFLALLQLGGRGTLQLLEQALPVRAHRALGIQQFVVGRGGQGIVV